MVGGIISKYHTNASNGYTLRLTDQSPYDGVSFDGKVTSTGLLQLNQWYHIAAVNDNNTHKLYINGVETALNGAAHTVYANSNPVRIGSDYASRYFDGNIDEVRLWNVARSESEIVGTMNTVLTGQENGLVAWYDFNQGDGGVLNDLSGNEHHGTINGATWSTNAPNMTETVFQPQTKNELQIAVNLWESDNVTAIDTYGNINTWDVSLITDMSNLFSDKNNFNSDISNWDVSNVTNMNGMFDKAYNFNGDISNWDVSSVTTMTWMFHRADDFNGDLSNWNVGSVTDMSAAFHRAGAFNSDLTNWDVSNVTSMSAMFYDAGNFNGDVSDWDVSNVTNMSHMFRSASSFNQPLNSWDVSSVVDMGDMFHTSGYNLPLDNWDVSNVTNMISLFRGSVFNQDISNWNTNSLTQLGYAFSLTSAFNQDISNWNTSNVVMMTDAFMGAEVFNQNLSNWDVSNVNDFSNMFLEAQAISDQNKCAIHT